MQHHTKRKVVDLVQRFNECVGAAARKVYTQQISAIELLQRPQCEIRQQLPEICAFVDSLSGKTTAAPPSSLVRCAFRHPDAQWLNRSARESGISALICQQLVRLARQDNKVDLSDENMIYWPPAELIMHVLLDALLLPCTKRLGKAPDACKWCVTQSKPRFHAMTCFPVWSTLLPFAALMGLRFPEIFSKVLQDFSGNQRHRVNCDFAQILGMWRLMEEFNRGDKENQSAVTNAMIQLLKFASAKVIGQIRSGQYKKKVAGSHLDDQLLEKFFTGLQEFAFKSGRSNAVIKPALLSVLQSSFLDLEGQTKIVDMPQHLAAFMAAGCVFVQGLASDIVSMLIERLSDTTNKCELTKEFLLNILVGFCAYVDLVSLPSVLDLLNLIIAAYKAVEQQTDDVNGQQQQRLKYVFYLVYVAYHRYQNVDILCQDLSSQSAMFKLILSEFQTRLCSDIALEDFCVAAPLHWMVKVWKHWVFLSDEDVQTFVLEAEDQDRATEQEFENRVGAWQVLQDRMAFRPASFSSFPHMNTLLKPHLISPLPLTDLRDDDGMIVQARKRRRSDYSTITSVDSVQFTRSLDVLLLPDVMERVCSFMSAKRLCRMALVCRTFAHISHRASLWQPLYIHIGNSTGKSAQVECHHGEKFIHNWQKLYQERWKVLRRLRRLRVRAIKRDISQEQEGRPSVSSRIASAFSQQICSFCGCNYVLKSAADLEFHQMQHKRWTCREVSCKASFTGQQKFNVHMRQHSADRFECGFESCQKSYKTLKWLNSHRQKEGHYIPQSQ
ncbi:FOG: Zn-finger [Plasmopara halstedii]|uniref:FOG: Zn-finger n=1 Tax=Plasmopara halstedii TaxID=4781 RepID=A0A0N7L5U2_PLAHL|nr:FOG: Zn-finger [Plasmopara halstedii]CEG42427.1 FOG: Zn-finger [Plasmopara halstedii]|eukprot:XP_024578796.1 FOG: Zn-finger [Plasmopara halstedii]